MGRRLSPHQFARRESGAALVFVLAMLVLVLTVVLAFFSRATLNRQIASASASNTKVQLIFQTAEAYVLDDFQREIEAGSTQVSPTNLSVQIHRPITLTNVGIGVTNTWAPSMVPQRVGDAGITNIVKISRGGRAFFTNGEGYTSNGTTRASAISTTNASANGRFMTKDRWNLPKLMADSETNAFVAPDWIYIDRQGNTPTDFSTNMASSESTNTNYVIGRYAYVVYDVGGLIDINVVGNQLPDAENSRRGRLNQVSLTNGIPGITDFASLVAWRSSVSSTNTNSAPGIGGLFDPKRTFIDVPTDEQAFVNRQDLLAYVASTNTISTNSLPFLTTFSRDLNAPSYEPNSARPMLPASPAPNLMNPALLTVRYGTNASNSTIVPITTLHRPEGNCTVKSGTPVMPRRFPLNKINLLEQSSPDTNAIKYYFGLTRNGTQSWSYNATTSDGRIAKLSEVAEQGREPNFFEILQAVIITGSLGKFGANTYTDEVDKIMPDYSIGYLKGLDCFQNFQVMHIGANIIDQWDSNDIPTCIEFGNPGAYFSFYGIENLPYISQISLAGCRPTYNKDLFQVWALFDVWNPHQNAKKLPSGIDGFRIVPVSGSGNWWLSYSISSWTAIQPLTSILYSNDVTLGGCNIKTGITKSIVELNGNGTRTVIFPATDPDPTKVDYSEPKTLGGVPSSSTDIPGLLMMECSPGMAIPPQGAARLDKLQISINSLMDAVAPYTTSNNSTGLPPDTCGRKDYPPGTTFSGLDPKYWLQELQLTGNITVAGKFGVKAHNCVRSMKRSDPYCFDLQYQAGGNWHTYQKVEGLFQQTDIASSPVNGLGFDAGGESVTKNATVTDTRAFFTNTHHSATDAALQNEFYTWRSPGASVGMIKADPRTSRFGLSSWNVNSSTPPSTFGLAKWKDFFPPSVPDPLPFPFIDYLGLSVRDSTADFTGSLYDRKWYVPGAGYSAGWGQPAGVPVVPGNPPGLVGEFKFYTGISGLKQPPLFGLVSNNPDALNAANPARYPDPDGVIRPGDGYFWAQPPATVPTTTSALPTARGQFTDRPILLNRPFRSVGELGYVFRDVPWKTLDFFSRRSGDLGLLDVFSISETDGDLPLTAGQINLNTRQTAVLAAVLLNSSKQLPEVNASVAPSELSAAQANMIAAAIVAESKDRPFADKGDLVTRVLNSGIGIDPLAPAVGESPETKHEAALKSAREAAVRTLAEIGTTRTWNFLIDLVAQTGRFTAASKNGSDFMVQGEERVWIHVAIDRITGEVLELRREVVNE